MAEVISICTRRPVLPKETVLAKMQGYVEELERIDRNDPFSRRTGKLSDLACRYVRGIQEDWARLRSAAPHILNDDPDVEALRLRFATVVRKTLH